MGDLRCTPFDLIVAAHLVFRRDERGLGELDIGGGNAELTSFRAPSPCGPPYVVDDGAGA